MIQMLPDDVDESYGTAYETIFEFFGSKRRQIHRHLKGLVELQAIRKENANELNTLLVNFKQHVRALESLDESIKTAGTILMFLLAQRLDSASLTAWEMKVVSYETNREQATLDRMMDFLSSRCRVMMNVQLSLGEKKPSSKTPSQSIKPTQSSKGASRASAAATSGGRDEKCKCCQESHPLWECEQFKALPVETRVRKIEEYKACRNCLSFRHEVRDCRNRFSCRVCRRRHNTTLHDAFASTGEKTTSPATVEMENDDETKTVAPCIASAASKRGEHRIQSSTGMLATALVEIQSATGEWVVARAFLDSGSQLNFMTSRLQQALKLKSQRVALNIVGFGGLETNSSKLVVAPMRSRVSNFVVDLEFALKPKIVPPIPTQPIDMSKIRIPDVELADPKFFIRDKVDVMVGSEVFYDLLLPMAEKRFIDDTLWLQRSVFGYLVVGKTVDRGEGGKKSSAPVVTLAAATEDDSEANLGEILERFWRIEERTTVKPPLTPEERLCEEEFLASHYRDESGRYVVRLPLKGALDQLGQTREQAICQFLSNERRLAAKEENRIAYGIFMKEYLNLGHMELCGHGEDEQKANHNYMAHHQVVRMQNRTTKYRTVFNGSAPSSSGQSINDLLANGKKCQPDIFPLLIGLREFEVAFSGDMRMMYRQILIEPRQRHLQSIIWRDDTGKPLQTYHLSTVTYGTKSAAWLSTRVLKQLAVDEGAHFPLGAKILSERSYVDDVMGGAKDVPEAIEAVGQLKALLARGGFETHKWASNSRELLEAIGAMDESLVEVKALGVPWKLQTDTFHPRVPPFEAADDYTKRDVASDIAAIYNPLGIIGPVVLRLKSILQRLSLVANLTWDSTLSDDHKAEWESFRKDLGMLNDVHVPRCLRSSAARRVVLVGFSDGSDVGYGACIYLRATDDSGQHMNYLLSSKSRVAPLKRITIPRMELSGALMLAEMMSDVRAALTMPIDRVYLFTDSEIVLWWIQRPPANLKLFVANRVSLIQQLSKPSQWRHVASGDNAADGLSRGQNAEELIRSSIWWQGPEFLSSEEDDWPDSALTLDESAIPELKIKEISLLSSPSLGLENFLTKFSSVGKIHRIVAYVIRYVHILHSRILEKSPSLRLVAKHHITARVGAIKPPTITELRAAETVVLREVQRDSFGDEIQRLLNGRMARKKGKIRQLAPFVDQNGVLRVGGRLRRSDLPFEQKFPALLSPSHHYTHLIFEFLHLTNGHAAQQLLLSTIQQRFWVVNGKSLARLIVHRCTTCFRAKPKPISQFMSDLPAKRIQSTRPFLHSGVDYAGPFFVKSGYRGRGPRKVWVVVFVCLATHAIHLDIVHDCTTDEFLAALQRFFARRGRCLTLHSDNSTTFVGAANDLDELQKLFESRQFKERLGSEAQRQKFEWRFIPPRSPHHGGMWEAAVKSMKFHLKRISQAESFSVSELETILAITEAYLNSRPLMAASTDPNDLRPLTPGHFLVGEPLNFFPIPDFSEAKLTLLSRWQLVQAKTQTFWKRWSLEHLNQLQQRSKWDSETTSAKVGELVIMVEENLPPMRWKMAHIVKLHPGQDGRTRVVTVRAMTDSGPKEYDRDVRRLCRLPMGEDG